MPQWYVLMMRTTVRRDERLLAEAKKAALENGRTFTAVLEDALRESLARRQNSAGCKPIRLKTFRACGVQPGIDLDDSALLDAMDS